VGVKGNMKIYRIAKEKVKVNKELLDNYGGYDVYLVNEEEIRNLKLADEEFTNFAVNDQFPSLIPKNEIWIGKEVSENERPFFIGNAVKLSNLLNKGMDVSKAYDKALEYEKALREKTSGLKENKNIKKANPPKEIYIKKYGTIGNDITVWIIDGELARDLYKTDYVEGGHGYVYDWIPKDEIWIEKDLEEDEIPYVLHHEYVELKLMKDKDMDYDKAHDIAAKKEFEMRKGKKQ
jgi:hypothetical protein